jgi:hypothetical protein
LRSIHSNMLLHGRSKMPAGVFPAEDTNIDHDERFPQRAETNHPFCEHAAVFLASSQS